MVKRINVTMQDDILSRADGFAASKGLTRSSLVQLALTSYIDAQEAMPAMNQMLALLGSLAKKAASTGGVDSEEYNAELKQLESMQTSLSKAVVAPL